MAAEIHVGDIGTSIRAIAKDEEGVVIDISAADEILFWFQRPDQTTFEKEASLVNSGTDGLMEYVTVEGDLDQPGGWKVQGVVDVAAGRWHGEVVKFKVFSNLRS